MHTTQADLQDSLKSLDVLSHAFERIAADPKHHNNPITQYLDSMSYEMRRMKTQAQDYIYHYGGL